MSHIKNTQVVNDLVNLLPSLYKDIMFNDKFIKLLLDSYVDVSGFIGRYAQSIYDNTSMSTAENFRNLEFATLTLKDSLYDVNRVANLFYASGGGNWYAETTSLRSKVDFLESLGVYESLDSKREWDVSNSHIISLKIARDFNRYLGYYDNLHDYVLRDNKLYVFNELAKVPQISGGEKTVLLTDIFVDVNKVENRWGDLISNFKPSFISPGRYAKIVSGVIKSLNEGLTIQLLNEVIAAITEPPISFFDKYSINLPIRYKYDMFNAHADGVTGVYLGEFDFIAELPASTLSIPEMRLYITQILNLMKPAYTNFGIYHIGEYSETVESMREFNKLILSKNLYEPKFGVELETFFKLNSLPLNSWPLGVDTRLNRETYALTQCFKTANEARYNTVVDSFSYSFSKLLTEIKESPLAERLSVLSKFNTEPKFGVELDTFLKLNSLPLNSWPLGMDTRLNRETYALTQCFKNANEAQYPSASAYHSFSYSKVLTEIKVSPLAEQLSILSTVNTEPKFGVELDTLFTLNASTLNSFPVGIDTRLNRESKPLVQGVKTLEENKYPQTINSHVIMMDRSSEELPFERAEEISSAFTLNTTLSSLKFGVTIPEYALLLNLAPLNTSTLFNPISAMEGSVKAVDAIKEVSENLHNRATHLASMQLNKVLTEESKELPSYSSSSDIATTKEELKFGIIIDSALILNSSPLNTSLLVPTKVKEIGGSIILTRVSDGYETIFTF